MSEQFQDNLPPAAPVRAKVRRTLFALTVILCGLSAAIPAPAQAQSADDGAWIGTWSASPQPVWEPDFFAPVNIPRALRNQTIRQVAQVSLGGDRVRVEFSNEYGDRPLVIGAAHIALADENGAIKPGSDHALTFGGNPSVTVPPGAPILSDPVDMPVEPLGDVAVSLFLPEITPTTTWHNDARQTAYISGEGNHTQATTFEPAQTIESRIFLSGIMVDAAPGARAVVLFGDSITDGDGSTLDANHRWPDFLAERLHQAGAEVAVLNEGISGARILRDRMGDNALARFDRDVLSHPHADTVVLMMGINDIGWPGTLLVPEGEPAPSAEDVITGYEQLIARAHANGMRIIGATLTPFADTFEGTPLFGYYDETKEAKRQAINDWIRTSGAFDGVIDFDAVTRNPDSPKHIQAAYDKGDHLHPNDTGYRAMADSVDLKLLGVNP
ncbi:SGNH/GDSL hydrolase family protein [Geminicoccus harenae]|uniref:SGNH/GDSL hydrolase family protein n=1 Tax=Geminicoccus harenae TaxID=2498453 RepID=UPI001C96ACD8|nr:SGNH/GDSL hydrolase family protein [Geminicoccus harenae]